MPDNRQPNDSDRAHRAYDFDMDQDWDVEKYLAQRQSANNAQQRPAPENRTERYDEEPMQFPRQENRQRPNAAYRPEQGYRRPQQRQPEPHSGNSGYRRPAKKKKSGNGKLYAVLAIILVLILIVVIWLAKSLGSAAKKPAPSASQDSVQTEPSETEPPTESAEVRAAALVQQADLLAASYDYDNAIAKLEEFGSCWEQQPTLADAKLRYNKAKQQTGR